MGLLNTALIIFVFTFVLGEIFRFDLGNNLYVKPIDVLIIILVLSWFIKNLKLIKTGAISKDSLFLPIVSVVGVLLASLTFNIKNFAADEMTVAFLYSFRWALYASLYFVIKNVPLKIKEKIISSLVIAGALLVLFGFIQYYFYSDLRNLYYLGWDEHMHRMFSVFLDPNFAGAFFVLYLFFLLSLILYLLDNNKTGRAWILGPVAVFTLASVFLTYSRSALIMLFASAVFFAILTGKRKVFFGIVLTGIVFVFISSGRFDIENINLFRIASSEARLDSARIAIRIASDNPILGTGFNTYRYARIKGGFADNGLDISHAGAGTDTSLLLVLATTGIVGLIFYLNLLWGILRKFYLIYKIRQGKNIQKYLAAAALLSVGGIIADSLFINSLFYSPIMIWLWVLLGIASRK